MEASDFIPGDWREWRRLRALHLEQQGWYQRDIAAALDVSEETVSRWLARVAPAAPKHSGRNPGRATRPNFRPRRNA